MSATVLYQPMKGKALKIGGTSSFLRALEDLFGGRELALDVSAVNCLMGLRAGLSSADEKEAVDELISAIHVHGTIRIWAEY